MPDSQTAHAGLALLRGGVEIIKFSSKGQPAVTLCKLSADETTLTWQAHGLGKLKKRKSDKRAIQMQDVERVDVGRESAAFRSAPPKAHAATAHLSLSLVMRPSAVAIDGRSSLDLCCADEESFGLLVAALRRLVARRLEAAAAAAAAAEALTKPWAAGLPMITAASPGPAGISTWGNTLFDMENSILTSKIISFL